MNSELNDNEEQLVADLAAEYYERWRAGRQSGQQVEMAGFLDRLPDEHLREAFKSKRYLFSAF